jgi:hypothetical protein
VFSRPSGTSLCGSSVAKRVGRSGPPVLGMVTASVALSSPPIRLEGLPHFSEATPASGAGQVVADERHVTQPPRKQSFEISVAIFLDAQPGLLFVHGPWWEEWGGGPTNEGWASVFWMGTFHDHENRLLM